MYISYHRSSLCIPDDSFLSYFRELLPEFTPCRPYGQLHAEGYGPLRQSSKSGLHSRPSVVMKSILRELLLNEFYFAFFFVLLLSPNWSISESKSIFREMGHPPREITLVSDAFYNDGGAVLSESKRNIFKGYFIPQEPNWPKILKNKHNKTRTTPLPVGGQGRKAEWRADQGSCARPMA